MHRDSAYIMKSSAELSNCCREGLPHNYILRAEEAEGLNTVIQSALNKHETHQCHICPSHSRTMNYDLHSLRF